MKLTHDNDCPWNFGHDCTCGATDAQKQETGPVNLVPVRLEDLLSALGASYMTGVEALAEVRRLKAKAEDPLKGLALNQALADWWPLDRPVKLDDMERLEGVLRDLFDVPPKPLGQGVAALLPEHGEVKS